MRFLTGFNDAAGFDWLEAPTAAKAGGVGFDSICARIHCNPPNNPPTAVAYESGNFFNGHSAERFGFAAHFVGKGGIADREIYRLNANGTALRFSENTDDIRDREKDKARVLRRGKLMTFEGLSKVG